jgi:biotin synthase-related radical SAM superfamily protein
MFQVTEKVLRVVNRGLAYEIVYLGKERHTISKMTQELSKSLTAMYTAALTVLAETYNLLEKNTFKRGFYSLLNSGKIGNDLKTIDDLESAVCKDAGTCEQERSHKADIDIMNMLKTLDKPITRIDENVTALLQHVEEETRLAMLRWVSDVPFGKYHADIQSKMTTGTG